MSEERKIKKIEMDALKSIDRNSRSRFWRRLAVFLGAASVIAGASFAAYRVMTGSVVGSRFAVNNMTCPACAITLKEVTGKIPGVVNTEVSLAGQDVIVKFRDKQTTPDVIRDTIYRAGYPAILDGRFLSPDATANDRILLEVNGRPFFERDLKIQVEEEKRSATNLDHASSIFSLVGLQALLQAADGKNVVVQPYEIEAQANEIMSQEMQQESQFGNWVNTVYGSKEKFLQHLAQRIGVGKLIAEHVTAEVSDPEEKRKKIIAWVSDVFLNTDVRILDPEVRQLLLSSLGSDDWKTLWPRMIAKESHLKNIVLR